jgi:conjugative transfer signal peptidase TraF
VGLFLLFAAAATVGRRAVVANPTQSVDPGLYLAVPKWTGGDVAIGQLVSFRIPEAARPYFAGHAGRPIEDAGGWYLIKPIIAGPGDVVDTTGDRVLVNGVDAGPIYASDSDGRALPRWRARRRLAEGEWFVVSRRSPGSLDGRYFGPIREGDVEYVRRPLVRWGDEGEPWRWFGTYVDRPLEQSAGEGEAEVREPVRVR